MSTAGPPQGAAARPALALPLPQVAGARWLVALVVVLAVLPLVPGLTPISAARC